MLIKPEGFLKLFFAVAKFDTGLHAPEKIRSQHGIPFFGVIVGHIADVPVDAKDFLQEQDARPRAYLGRREIALEFTRAIRCRDIDIRACHCPALYPNQLIKSKTYHTLVAIF